MSHTLPTEPLRAEHRELLPHIDELDDTADRLADADSETARRMLADIVAFLRGHLVPHAIAEERVLYPAVEDAMSAPAATATMRADHTEIVSRIDRLDETAGAIDDGWPNRRLAVDLDRQLAGLGAILRLHFHKEEEVLLPVLDRSLSANDAEALFKRMASAAHD